MQTRAALVLAVTTVLSGRAPAAAADVPLPIRSTEHRYDAQRDNAGSVVRGGLRRVRTEHRDERGRLVRWEERDADGTLQLTWVGVFLGDGLAPDRAAYWNADALVPFPELFVTSADGRVQDVLYGDPGEKPRRQMRQYLDAAGREIYQEYFGPRSQRKYSEEIYEFDDAGNELGRTWRRLDGRAQRVTRFEILARSEHGHWTRRLVHVDGALDAVDEREIESGSVMRPHPPASAGPVEPSSEILPIPFAAGIVSTRGTGENALTFAPDGKTVLFTRYADDWKTQRAYFAVWRDGAWREPEPVPFAETMYNAALSADGGRIIFCRRDDELGGGRVFVTARTDEGWSDPIDLTERDGLTGSYFRLLADGTAYFHRAGDLFRCTLAGDAVRDVTPLGAPINTPDGVEFGAWVDADEQRIIFARGVEGAPDRTGVFVAFRENGTWTTPTLLPIPYGWSIVLSPDGEDLVYVVDDEVCRVPVVLLAEWLEREARPSE
jgi:hypothetical protein